MNNAYFDRHRETLEKAVVAIHTRDYWSPYAEAPSERIYGENANAKGKTAFEGRLRKPFTLDLPGIQGQVGPETSPYGMEIGITYPSVDLDVLLPAMQKALPAWRDAGVEARAGICLEILQRLNQRSFELAYAVMHTSGQGFVMAFQAGGPHAQDRGLEAIAYAYEEMIRTPPHATWTKPQGKHDPLRLDKTYHVVPRGIALVVCCSTFPTWNTYPGLFASLVTGNPVVVKPHPGAVLPVAITVETAQEVLKEAGFEPCLMSMAADSLEAPITKTLAVRPEIRLIDFTGSSAFGDWLEQNARQALVFTEKAGVNSVVIDSTTDLKGMVRNLAFSLSLYSGQMCTAPQDIFVPREGIQAGDRHLSFDELARAIGEGVTKFLSDPERAAEVLGAIQSPATLERLEQAAKLGDVVLASEVRPNPHFPQARVRSPLILKVDARDEGKYTQELFGPIAILIATDGTEHSIALARKAALQHGAITWSVYSADEKVLQTMEAAAMEAGVALSCNLTDGVFVNQSAAYSDFHASGANPASTASLSDAAFVANRFRVIQSRRHAA